MGCLLGIVLGLLLPARGAQAAGRLFAIELVDSGLAAYQIVELNPNTLKIIRGIPLPQPHSADGDGGALAYDGANLWYINGFTGAYLYRLDPETGAVRQLYPLLSTDTPGDYPVGLAVRGPRAN